MRFLLTRDAEELASRARPCLATRLDFNVIAGVLEDILAGAHVGGRHGPRFAYGLDRRGELVFVALRAPPWPLLSSALDPTAAPAFLARWLEQDPALPGVTAPADTARSLAAAWCAAMGGEARVGIRQALHALEGVRDPPGPAAGRLREATEDELPLILRWWEEFSREAGAAVSPGESYIRLRVKQGRVFLWERGGPVALAVIAAAVAGVARIGPVYTPLEHRRHGYASAAVAALSRLALGRGARACILFTDLANPTANKIYARVGYRRIADWEERRFIAGA